MVHLNPADGETLGVDDGAEVTVRSDHGGAQAGGQARCHRRPARRGSENLPGAGGRTVERQRSDDCND